MPERKYKNGQVIICKDNSYNFESITIRKLAKSNKKDPCKKYLCDVKLKNYDSTGSWYIYENVLDNIIENL